MDMRNAAKLSHEDSESVQRLRGYSSPKHTPAKAKENRMTLLRAKFSVTMRQLRFFRQCFVDCSDLFL